MIEMYKAFAVTTQLSYKEIFKSHNRVSQNYFVYQFESNISKQGCKGCPNELLLLPHSKSLKRITKSCYARHKRELGMEGLALKVP